MSRQVKWRLIQEWRQGSLDNLQRLQHVWDLWLESIPGSHFLGHQES
jgi:hypothetical protein